MIKRLVIIGAGGHGKVCANIAFRMNQWEEIVFLDDKQKTSVFHFEVIGKLDFSLIQETDEVFVAIGDNQLRSSLIHKLQKSNFKLAKLIDPSAVIGLGVIIGSASVIMPNVVINADAYIGQGVILNSSSIIEHDCEIEDFVHISPNATIGGGSHISAYSWVGIGATVIQSIKFTNHVIIGAGSTVTKDINDSGVYVGCPVRKIS